MTLAFVPFERYQQLHVLLNHRRDTISPTVQPSASPTPSPTAGECDLMLDLIFILDSSSSVYANNKGYDDWQAEIDFAKAVVNKSLPDDARVGLIIFGGCGTGQYNDLDACRANGKLVKKWGLNAYGTPNDQDAVYSRFSAVDSSDFTGGWTWTDGALYMAWTEFQANSSVEHSKMIILLTDGTYCCVYLTALPLYQQNVKL